MASHLLKCSICPKRPTFSDTSHLLTHISSKGHLSHLHKLQVRSHQEIAAGHDLALYNQWFQQHGVAQLLSERMLQKEAKQASKKAANRRRAVATTCLQKTEILREQETNLFLSRRSGEITNHLPVCNPKTRPVWTGEVKIDQAMDDPWEPVSKPEQRPSRRTIPKAPSTPVKESSPLEGSDNPDDGDTIVEPAVHTPESGQLKGIVWPGMTMFDAATEGMKRRRNQKKDGSILQHMERTSTLVEPTETVYSPGGTMRKQRHMDDLEDDSLVEGETPLVKPSAKNKRRSLSRKSSGTPPQARRPKGRPRKGPRPPVMVMPHGGSSSPSASASLCSRLLAANSEKIVAGVKIKRRPEFVVHADDSPEFAYNGSFDELPNPFLDAEPNICPPDDPQIALPPMPWLRPTHQQAQTYDPFKALRPAQPLHLISDSSILGKENMQPVYLRPQHFADMQNTNPLSWKHRFEEEPANFGLSPASLGEDFGGYDTTLEQMRNPHLYIKNPLMAALAHYNYNTGTSSVDFEHAGSSPHQRTNDSRGPTSK